MVKKWFFMLGKAKYEKPLFLNNNNNQTLMAIQLSQQQQQALSQLQQFSKQPQTKCFVLTGFAGTGKTTLVGHYVDWLLKNSLVPVLLATTGRAAKVLINKTGKPAATIHSQVYTFNEVHGTSDSESGQISMHFDIRPSPMGPEKYVYIVDEASMISNTEAHGEVSAQFGSGHLLRDFLQYTQGHKIVFVGDPCQLPPVSDDTFSPALNADYLRTHYRLPAEGFQLSEIHRQNSHSEILQLAGRFRDDIIRERYIRWPKMGAPSGRQASLYRNDQALLEAYLPYLRKRNYEQAVMIVHANRHNQQINMAIRQQLWGANTPLRPGELLQVVQNSYLVPLSNGDQVIVEDITPDQRVAGFQFAKMKLRKAGDNQVYETMVMLDLLHKDDPALSKRDTQTLLIDFDIRCRKKNINRKSIIYNQLLRSDPYLNALRVKYGYATTCHKAQGGEWPQVFLNIGSTIFALSDNARYRWFYTAITRASQHLHVNDGYWVEGFNQRQPR